MKDYYTILGIAKNASTEEIKKAFHRLAHKHHPLKGGDEKKFKEINQAYQVLSNKEKRAQYDRFGQTFEGAGAGAQPGFDFGSFWQNARGGDFDFGIDFEDIFEDFFGFGKTGRQRRKINQGEDIEIEMAIDLKDTLNGIKKNINLGKKIVCQRCRGLGAEPGTKLKECFSCRGTGEVQQMKKTFFGTVSRYVLCPECKGEGRIPEQSCNVCRGEGRLDDYEDVEIYIPAGVDSGQMIKIDGQGDAGRRGAKSGDLYVKIFIKPHSLFQRKGDDLYLTLPISFSQAALGDEIEVPTLDGLTRSSTEAHSKSSPQSGKKILLKVPSGMESGRVFRISGRGIPHFSGFGQGIPHFSGFGRGSLYVELVIKTPKKLTKQQKELLEKLKEQGL